MISEDEEDDVAVCVSMKKTCLRPHKKNKIVSCPGFLKNLMREGGFFFPNAKLALLIVFCLSNMPEEINEAQFSFF